MRVFVFGLGGGGDVVSSLIAYNYMKKLGNNVSLGAVVWERYIVDPLPGPICNNDLINIEKINKNISIVNKNSYAIRGEFKIVPQLVKVVRILSEKGIEDKGYSICIKDGVKGTVDALFDLVNKEKIDLIIGVDAGGDVLGKGCEDTLMSPLIDNIVLSALSELKKMGINTILGTIGLGSDGELEHEYLVNRIAEIASLGGLLDIKGIDVETARLLNDVLEHVDTEASRIPLEAFKGFIGKRKIRRGTKEVYVTPFSAVMFLLDPEVVASTNLMYPHLRNTTSLEEVNDIFHNFGVYTEYDFEKDLFEKFGYKSKEVDVEEIIKIRNKGKNRFIKKIKC
jgi:hypothetical protein